MRRAVKFFFKKITSGCLAPKVELQFLNLEQRRNGSTASPEGSHENYPIGKHKGQRCVLNLTFLDYEQIPSAWALQSGVALIFMLSDH